MFRMAGGARDACLTMCGDDGGNKAFGLMTGLAVCIHLLSVCHAQANRMAEGAGITIRLFGNRRHRGEGLSRVRIGNRIGSESVFVSEGCED